MKVVHTYINNMYIDPTDKSKECFANRWGLVSLVKLGHDVTLICGGDMGSKERKEYVWNGVKVIELPTRFGINNTTRVLRGFVRELREVDADVFHTHHYSSFVPEITLAIGKTRGIPTFLTFHNTFVEGNWFRKVFGAAYLLFLQPLLPLFSKSLFISNYTKNKISFKILSEKKKETIYNTLRAPPKMDVSKRDNSIFYIGRITHQKGIDVLIKALFIVKKEIPNVVLNIVGGGETKYKHFLRGLIEKHKLQENINFLGKKFGSEKWRLFYSSEIMVVPSRDEGFGNVVVEGMLCGLPVIVSNKGALAEAAGGHGVVFNINKPKSLAKKISALLKHKEYRESVVNKQKAYAESFTKRKIGEELLREYTRFLK